MINSVPYWIITFLLLMFIPFIGIFLLIYGIFANGSFGNNTKNIWTNNQNTTELTPEKDTEETKELNDVKEQLFSVDKEMLNQRYKDNKISKDEYIEELESLKAKYNKKNNDLN